MNDPRNRHPDLKLAAENLAVVKAGCSATALRIQKSCNHDIVMRGVFDRKEVRVCPVCSVEETVFVFQGDDFDKLANQGDRLLVKLDVAGDIYKFRLPFIVEEI